ncbi:MAG: hypothetical protein Q4G58_17435, partial [bacterium]|nr:hypothetical protein [bacterium]
MKKSYLLLLCGLCLMTACSSTSNTKKQTIATLSPTIYKNENNVDASTNTNDENSSPYDFLIERYLLKDPGSNITVDSALNLIIDQINPAMRVKLKSGERIAYKFLGYRLFDDG